ncbi:hypothetical protein EES47_10825 [Streptomyces sp. ADI98-12]|nr:hypothetical protein EES47_10825 [Streptomyces sp. ADI98-12]
MSGVTGWCSAKACSQVGIVSIGTKALLGYGRNIRKKVNPLAPSGVLASSPTQAASQETATR